MYSFKVLKRLLSSIVVKRASVKVHPEEIYHAEDTKTFELPKSDEKKVTSPVTSQVIIEPTVAAVAVAETVLVAVESSEQHKTSPTSDETNDEPAVAVVEDVLSTVETEQHEESPQIDDLTPARETASDQPAQKQKRVEAEVTYTKAWIERLRTRTCDPKFKVASFAGPGHNSGARVYKKQANGSFRSVYDINNEAAALTH